jgi:S1-C subfamily serine protease
MIRKILKVLGIVTLVFCLTIITIRLNSLENIINGSISALQGEIETLQSQSYNSFKNDLFLSNEVMELVRNSVKEVDYRHIIKTDVLVMSIFGSGAGTVVKKTDNEMYVLTCYHVVEEIVNANNQGTKMNAVVGYTLDDTGDSEDLKSFVSFSAFVVKYDVENDLALLKINYSDPNLEVAKLAEVEPQQGDVVYSVGSPLGLLRNVSKGILANKLVGFYISDNTTTFGNSGGGLYNKDGELIGVPSNVLGYKVGLEFVPESSLGLSRDLPTIKAFLEGVEY